MAFQAHTCPFCGTNFPIINETTHYQTVAIPWFKEKNLAPQTSKITGRVRYRQSSYSPEDFVTINFYKCSNCDQIDAIAKHGSKALPIECPYIPQIYPDYIKEDIRNRYNEACSVLYLSPKASAVLSRYCMQGMIRDLWGTDRNNLNQELIEIKRTIIKTKRLCKILKNSGVN